MDWFLLIGDAFLSILMMVCIAMAIETAGKIMMDLYEDEQNNEDEKKDK